jgi:hypothetical protein
MSVARGKNGAGVDSGRKSEHRQGNGGKGQDKTHKTIAGSLRKAAKGFSGALPVLLGCDMPYPTRQICPLS